MSDEAQFSLIVWAVLIAGVMPVICAGIAKWGRPDYDNHNPRGWLASLEDGYRARAHSAQQNSLEAFPFFAAAVVFAFLGGSDLSAMLVVSWLFIIARVAYVACYLSAKATWRSIFWLIGYCCVIYLFVLAML